MKKLYRSKKEKIIAGVLGGIAEYLNTDPTIVRLVFVILLIATGLFPFGIAYLIAAIVIPYRNEKDEGVVSEQ